MFRTLFLIAVALPFALYAQDTGWPRDIAHDTGELTLEQAPQRIVSTSPSLTGILLAIDAPLVATAATAVGPLTDDKGFFHQWAQAADAQGVAVLYPNLQFDIEALIGATPDLVVASSTGGDSGLDYMAELDALGIPAIALNYADQSWPEMARMLGRATGREQQAEEAIASFAAYSSDATARIAVPKGGASIVGYDIGGSWSIGKSDSPQAEILTALGFTVEPLPENLRGAVTRSSDFDFISRENLSAAITGETVFLLAGDERDVAAFMADPVLANHPAVLSGRVYPLGKSSFRIDPYSGRQMIDTVLEHLPTQ
ncbi:Fe2+-enterobactin ABC transporter substrate-binding protein [Paracoccus albus]|uniref:Fe2+-enterobactin ABC transporter substrate-binding protein n=1 Tax=Paracoccus albus TaxID=3017784 RepID=UPI0022F09DBB|nr:Fe2+-enterobactin ABC transporter substrate-binding protein [Paracoccus albus]WBU62150.1 Fe2+-enterobactin ABC transporter substrate-binding protein [Paracoccus albus]